MSRQPVALVDDPVLFYEWDSGSSTHLAPVGATIRVRITHGTQGWTEHHLTLDAGGQRNNVDWREAVEDDGDNDGVDYFDYPADVNWSEDGDIH